MIGDDFIENETGCFSLFNLMIQDLFDGRYACVEECRYGSLRDVIKGIVI